MSFRFFDAGPLIDDDLELIPPSKFLIDDYLAGLDRAAAGTTRQQIEEFLDVAPQGRHHGDSRTDRLPCYYFWMRLRSSPSTSTARWTLRSIVRKPALSIGGSISLRIGHSQDIQRNLGHIGYNVQPFARGNHYAERACRLLEPLALHHQLNPIWITCNPDNLASRKTCERLGASLIEVVKLPPDHPLRLRGDREKCRYRWDVGETADRRR